MKLETFFEKFEQFAEAPNAVAKLRELVLQLAVQGKLLPQDLDDEPAEALLRRIDSEREHLVRAKQIRRQESLGPIADDETPFSIPGSWQWCRLGDICFVITDGAHHTPNYLETGVPFLSVKDVSGGKINFSNTRFISEEAHRELCKRCRPEPGDILLTKVGTTGIAVTVDDSREFSLFVSLALLKFSHKNLDRRYLKYLINSPFVRQQSADNTQGIGNKNLVLRLINQFSVPIPPLAEQKRIVAKVDVLMALCDRLEAQQQERDTRHAALANASLARFADAPTPANLNLLFHLSYAIAPADLRKTILTLAVQGKLAPASETKHVVLGEVIELISGQHLLAHEHNKEGKGIPYLTGPSDFGARHPNPTRWTETPKVAAEPGDILITVKGAGVGKTNKLVAERTAISRQLMAVRVVRADPDFIRLVLMDSADHFQSSMTGIAIPGIGRKDVLELKVELPPLAEQRKIVAKVDQLMALVDQLEAQLTASRTASINLMEAVAAELTV